MRPARTLSCMLAAAALVACGARTGLFGPLTSETEVDGGIPVDSGTPVDSGAPCEAGPPQLAYALDGSGILYRYDPTTGQATMLGSPSCGDGNVAWTMTASSDTAYILYTDWVLYAVDLATLACTQTPFQNGQLGLQFEYGIAVAGGPGAERLYVYGQNGNGGAILASSDLSAFVLSEVGEILPAPPASSFPVNLTADGYGHLYAFSPTGWLQEIDETTGAVIHAVQTGVTTGGTWATLSYGTDLFLWVDTQVVGYDFNTDVQTSSHDAGVAAIGGSSVVMCP